MDKKTYRIVFMGPQASGKGTQAEFMSNKLNIPNISVGNLFRNHIESKTNIGQLAEEYIKKGELVPSIVTIKMTMARLQEPDCVNGFILDGFPRDREQYDALNEFIEISYAIEIWISDKEAIERLGGRRSSGCGSTYHLIYNPPKVDGICDKCGEKLYIREDDKPDAIKTRLGIYHEQSEPLIELYAKKGVHIKINGGPSIDQVYKDILQALNLD